MKNMLIIASLCLTLCFVAEAADTAETSELTVLRQDSLTNYSEMNVSLFSSLYYLGYLNGGEAVKFTAPKDGWKLQSVQIVGWSGYDDVNQTYPDDRNILLEVRDSNLNLLYKFADTQNSYFLSERGPVMGVFEIPAVTVSGDFYVIFYDRGAVEIIRENNNATGNSYLFLNGNMVPAKLIDDATNETTEVNWLIEAVGN